jgi:hypothetical protein
MGREETTKRAPQIVDLLGSCFWSSRIIYYHIGKVSLGIQRFLRSLTTVKVLLTPPSLPGTPNPQLPRRFYENEMIAKSVPTGLNHHRRVQHNGRRPGV